ncbi:hypothetical protein V6N12_031115 [Hibiscus sabdariffa]|uniref:Uncharacterized protein n=1 Tax=Hibiscus sabdariffa TaxID=183260 RepID=A0ABR2E7Z2_9ROSI
MQNPSSTLWHNVEASPAINGLISGNQGGCPPDEVKKGRSVEEIMMVEDTPMEAMRDKSVRTGGSTPVMVHPDEIAQPPNIPFFKDKLMGNPRRPMPAIQRQCRRAEEWLPKKNMGSRFVILEDETNATREGADDAEAVAISTAIPGAGGVVMVDYGSENVRLGVSASSPRKRDTVDKCRVVDRHKESMLHVRESVREGVGVIQERTMRQQGVVASQGKVV